MYICLLLGYNIVFVRLFQIDGFLAAVDATKEKAVSDRFKIKGFPTGKKVVSLLYRYRTLKITPM